jgi:transcriptional regulator with XRE-family HTH domain
MDELCWLLRQERWRRLWPQQKVADACGLSRQQLSRYETGTATPTWALFRRVLAAYGLQPRIELDPLDADVVDAIERQRSEPAATWLSDVGLAADSLHRLLAELEWQASGLLALRLLGAPAPLRELEVEVPLDDQGWDRLVENAWLCGLEIWNPDLRMLETPRDALHLRRVCAAGGGKLRWPDASTLLVLRAVEHLGGEGIRIDVGGWRWRVVSPENLNFDDPWTARILDALRQEGDR